MFNYDSNSSVAFPNMITMQPKILYIGKLTVTSPLQDFQQLLKKQA